MYYIPTDTENSPESWGKIGDLTDLGKNQMKLIGQQIRQRYNDYLPEVYNYKDLYVRSSNYDRTLISANIILGSLYERQKEIIGLNFAPIPVYTKEKETEKVKLILKSL